MRLIAAVPAVAVLAVLVSGCASRTPAEDKFLAAMAESSTQIKISDSQQSKYLADGHVACEVLKDTKPGDRAGAKFLLQQPGVYGYGVVDAAVTHLCPEVVAG